MNPQQAEALRRAGLLLGAMLVGGLVAVFPNIVGQDPLDTHALIRAFVGGAIGVVVKRYGEGVLDGRRAAALRQQADRGAPLTALKESDVAEPLVSRIPPKVHPRPLR